MLDGLKIRSHRQFIQGNRSVSVSERDDGTLVVTPMITDLGAKGFLYPENDEETVRTDDRSASNVGEIVLGRFEHTREA